MLDHVFSPFTVAELALALAVLALALTVPWLGARFYETTERRGAAFAAHPLRQILAVGLLAIAVRAMVLPWLGVPTPVVHDEQSLMLQAQTYLAGRLANPTHPFWEHFETFYVNQIPVYASMYFPGRGVPLAVGLLIAHNAWVGVWLSWVLMCMAAVWMLQGWVSLPMAFLGGVLVVARFGIFSYWINSYWGGAFTALGGMLVVGAMPRILREPGWRHGVLIGLGAVILMTTRPYEGMLLCAPVAVFLLARWAKTRWGGARLAFVKIALPATMLVGAGGAILMAHNVALTGDPFTTGYTLNRMTYATVPAFLTAPPFKGQERGPSYFRDFYDVEAKDYVRRYSPVKVVASVLGKFFHTWNFYIGAIFTAAFLAGLWSERRDRFLLGTTAFFMAGYALEVWNFPHYTAPLFPILLIILMRGFEWLRKFELRNRPVGLFLTRAMPTAGLLVLLVPTSTVLFGVPVFSSSAGSQACCALPQQDLRSNLMQQFRATPGRDLVLVVDGPNSPLHYDLVYNEPDIDKSEVVFAHSLGAQKDLRLREYFADRRAWKFEWRPDLPQGYLLTPLEPLKGAVRNGQLHTD